jgi:hypothetical protein
MILGALLGRRELRAKLLELDQPGGRFRKDRRRFAGFELRLQVCHALLQIKQ